MEEYLEISRQLVEIDGGNLDWQLELSYAHSNLGSLLQAEGKLEEALAEFQGSLAIKEELVAAQADNRPWRTELAAGHNTVAVVLRNLGRLSAAREHFEAENEILSSLVEEDPTDLRPQDFLATSHTFLSKLDRAVGDRQSSAEHLREARKILLRLVEHDPDNADRRFKLALNQLDLGWNAFETADLSLAEREWRQAQQTLDDLLAADDTIYDWRWMRADLGYYRGLLLEARGEKDAARDAWLHAVETLNELAGEQPSHRWVHLSLARCYLVLGTLEPAGAAVTAFREAARHLQPFVGDGTDAPFLEPWAAILRCLGRHDEAAAADERLRLEGYPGGYYRRLCPTGGARSR